MLIAYLNHYLNKFLSMRRAHKIIGYIIQNVFLGSRTLQQINAFSSVLELCNFLAGTKMLKYCYVTKMLFLYLMPHCVLFSFASKVL